MPKPLEVSPREVPPKKVASWASLLQNKDDKRAPQRSGSASALAPQSEVKLDEKALARSSDAWVRALDLNGIKAVSLQEVNSDDTVTEHMLDITREQFAFAIHESLTVLFTEHPRLVAGTKVNFAEQSREYDGIWLNARKDNDEKPGDIIIVENKAYR